MSGLDLQSRLRGGGLSIPVIIVTGHFEDWFKDLALKRGAVAFLKKPVDPDALAACLDKAVRNS